MSNIYRGILVKPTVTTSTTVYTCNATSRAIIQNIQLTNQSGTHTAEVFVYDSSTTSTAEIGHVSLGSNATENLCKGPIVLEEGDALLITVNNTAITGIVSIMEVNRGSLTN